MAAPHARRHQASKTSKRLKLILVAPELQGCLQTACVSSRSRSAIPKEHLRTSKQAANRIKMFAITNARAEPPPHAPRPLHASVQADLPERRRQGARAAVRFSSHHGAPAAVRRRPAAVSSRICRPLPLQIGDTNSLLRPSPLKRPAISAPTAQLHKMHVVCNR